MTNFIQIATDLINRGFSVIPIEPKGKRPVPGIGVKSRLGKNDAYWFDRLDGWGDAYPDANVGVCADENIVILETDDFEKLSQSLVNAGWDVPRVSKDWLTACGSSPNRPHFFFKRTEKATNVGNLVVPGLFECRFQNQYVVGVGSVHPSGAVYRWLNDCDIMSIPDWLVSELARLAQSQPGRATESRTIAMSGGRVTEGSRHYFLMRELGRLHTGKLSEDELLEKALELNELCDPPKDLAHVQQCVRDIIKRDPYDPGPKVVIGSSTPHQEVVAPDTILVRRDTGAEWSAQSVQEFSIVDTGHREAFLTENESPVFYERSVNQAIAWRGVGKTMFALALAGVVGSGGRLLDFKADKPRRVLYLDGELPLHQLQERTKLLIPKDAWGNVFLFNPEMMGDNTRSLNLVNKPDFEALRRLIDRVKPQVLILDSQSTLMNGDTLDSRFQENRQEVLRALRWMDLCVIEMHHLGKGGLQRGSSKNDDILDVQMKLDRTQDWEPEDGLRFELVYEKVRHAAKLDSGYEVYFQDGKWHKQRSNVIQQVADLLKKQKSLRQIANELDINKSRVVRLKAKAIKQGLIELNEKTEGRSA